MRGRFITFEGLDGSGKSTHLERARRWLNEEGVACVVTHEPGGTPIGERIRSIFLDEEVGELDGVLELLMVFASRRRHLTEVIEPALGSATHVLCDRFTDSSFAYQGAGRGLSEETIEEVDEIATGRRVPDLTLLFDVTAEVAFDRGRSRREAPGGSGTDRLDQEDLAFYGRVREGFLRRAAADPDRFVVIDSEGPIEETSAAVRAALGDLVGGGGE